MDTLTRCASIRERVRVWREFGQTVALIPTTGTLHKGHMSLVAEAQERADRVIVSCFSDSPRRDGQTFEADRELVANVGADLLFVPPIQEMFPVGRESSVSVTVPFINEILQGAADLGRLQNTTTVLVKLFNIVHPDIVLFGERHIQQLLMVRRLVDDLFLSIEIVSCPTFRDSDGLAFATVNRSLDADARQLAPTLHATLAEIAAAIDAGERDYASLQLQGGVLLEAAGFSVEYLAVRRALDLAPVDAESRDLVILAAARLGGCRLTDNVRVRLIDRF